MEYAKPRGSEETRHHTTRARSESTWIRVVASFVLACATSGCGGDVDTWMARLESYKSIFTPGKITSVTTCEGANRLRVSIAQGQTCDISIPEGDGFVRSLPFRLARGRRLALELLEGTSAGIVSPSDVRVDGSNDGTGEVYVFSGAATLRARCVLGDGRNPCLLVANP